MGIVGISILVLIKFIKNNIMQNILLIALCSLLLCHVFGQQTGQSSDDTVNQTTNSVGSVENESIEEVTIDSDGSGTEQIEEFPETNEQPVLDEISPELENSVNHLVASSIFIIAATTI